MGSGLLGGGTRHKAQQKNSIMDSAIRVQSAGMAQVQTGFEFSPFLAYLSGYL